MRRPFGNKYRSAPADPDRGSPIHQYGELNAWRVGDYWTVAVDVPLSELAALKPVLQSKSRLASMREARLNGVALPPIEIGVFPDGSGWLMDGNHRLLDARKAGLASVESIFTFAGPQRKGRRR
jgi:hypothetical protein